MPEGGQIPPNRSRTAESQDVLERIAEALERIADALEAANGD